MSRIHNTKLSACLQSSLWLAASVSSLLTLLHFLKSRAKTRHRIPTYFETKRLKCLSCGRLSAITMSVESGERYSPPMSRETSIELDGQTRTQHWWKDFYRIRDLSPTQQRMSSQICPKDSDSITESRQRISGTNALNGKSTEESPGDLNH